MPAPETQLPLAEIPGASALDRVGGSRRSLRALLMKDAGCSSNAARICQLYIADDISFNCDFMTVNSSLP
jgi:hypothetical protein